MIRWRGIGAMGLLMFGILNLSIAAPVVFHVSDPIGPNETAVLFGDGLSGDLSAEGWALPDGPIAGPSAASPTFASAAGQRLEILQASELCAKVLLPTDWPRAMYALRLQGPVGKSAPIYLNRTEPWWWLGEPGDVATPGGMIRVFGKNLGEKPSAWLVGSDKTIRLMSTEANPAVAGGYHARFTLPTDIAPGQCRLWVHNGHGGPLGFGRPLAVEVKRSEPWPTTQFDVRQYGAIGDGEADDTPAFEAALGRARASGGGVVYIPRGRYKLIGKLVIPSKTVVRGQQRELVWLVVPKELPEFETVLAGNGDFAVEDLSIVAQTPRRLVVCPDCKGAYNMPWGNVPPDQLGRNAHLRRLRLHHLRYAHRVQGKKDPRRQEDVGPSTVLLAGPDMEMTDCEVVSPGMPLVLIGSRHGVIRGNRLDTGRNGWYGIWGAEETVFENNEIQGRDLEGSYGGVQGKASRLFIAGNRFHDAYGCEREALTFDTPYHPTWMGRFGSIESNSLTAVDYEGKPKTWTPDALVGQICLVAHGKGLGQFRRIVGNTETTIRLAEGWAVSPDDSSHLVVRVDKSDVVIAGNTFADASAAVQLYSQSLGFIVDGNTAQRTGGMYAIGWDAVDQRQRRRYSTCWFNQWLNNRLSEGFIYQQGAFPYGVLGPCAAGGTVEPTAIVALANVVRNNHLADHQTTGAMYFARHPLTIPPSAAGYFGRDTVVENNTIADTPLAIDVYPRYIDTLVRGNRVERAEQPLRDDGLNTWIHPAERLDYQWQAVDQVLGAEFATKTLRSQIEQLRRQRAAADETRRAAAKIYRELLTAVVGQGQHPLPASLAASLLGLHFELPPSSPIVTAIARGKAGKSELTLRARTEPWSPEFELAVALTSPDGWQPANSAGAVSIKPGVLAEIKSPLQIPEASDVKQLRVRLTATLDRLPLLFEDSFDVAQREILNWLVLGPLANRSGALPDTEVHAAERRLHAGATYDGLSGKIAWHPQVLENRYLNFAKIWKPGQPATTLAIACLRVSRPTTVLLQVHSRGVLELTLSGQPIAKIDPPAGGQTVRVALREGDNLLVAKSSFLTGPWELALDVKPLAREPAVLQVPAAELAQLDALRPSRSQPPRRGGLSQAGSVAWRELLADDFQRSQIGAKWSVASGTWTIREGVLHGQQHALLALKEKIGLPLRIEYDASSPSPADLSCFWLRDAAEMQSGCLFAFAAGDSGSRIQYDGARLAESDAAAAKGVANRWYHVIAQILPDGSAELFVDDKSLLRAKLPVRSDARGFPGLWTWGEGTFDNVRIFTGPAR